QPTPLTTETGRDSAFPGVRGRMPLTEEVTDARAPFGNPGRAAAPASARRRRRRLDVGAAAPAPPARHRPLRAGPSRAWAKRGNPVCVAGADGAGAAGDRLLGSGRTGRGRRLLVRGAAGRAARGIRPVLGLPRH